MEQDSTNMFFESCFKITGINLHKKRFERVDRLVGKSEITELELIMDINSEIYPVRKDTKLTVACAHSIRGDGQAETGEYTPDIDSNIYKDFEYITYGKIFKIEHLAGEGRDGPSKLAVYVSFGGLLMKLAGDAKSLVGFVDDKNVYCLVRKTF